MGDGIFALILILSVCVWFLVLNMFPEDDSDNDEHRSETFKNPRQQQVDRLMGRDKKDRG